MSDFFRLQKRIDELSAIGARDGAVTRLGLSAEEQAARDLVGSWCAARGAQVRRDAAANLFARFPGERDKDPLILVGSESWHKGVVGLVASRLTERFHRPSCVIAWASEGGAKMAESFSISVRETGSCRQR